MEKIKVKHTNAKQLICDTLKERGLKSYSPNHVWKLINEFKNGKITQKSLPVYEVWLEVKNKYNNWD